MVPKDRTLKSMDILNGMHRSTNNTNSKERHIKGNMEFILVKTV